MCLKWLNEKKSGSMNNLPSLLAENLGDKPAWLAARPLSRMQSLSRFYVCLREKLTFYFNFWQAHAGFCGVEYGYG
jgi:hypothetical protein